MRTSRPVPVCPHCGGECPTHLKDVYAVLRNTEAHICPCIEVACGHLLCEEMNDTPPCPICDRCDACCRCSCPRCGTAVHAAEECPACGA